jgi:hypothetical protein
MYYSEEVLEMFFKTDFVWNGGCPMVTSCPKLTLSVSETRLAGCCYTNIMAVILFDAQLSISSASKRLAVEFIIRDF